MATTDPTTLALTGQLPFILSTGAILALPLSFLLLRLYRRAVLKGMNRRSEKPTDSRKAEAAVRAEQGESASGGLRVSIVDAAAEQGAGHAGETLYRRACSNPWRAGLVYLAGGCLFAAVMTFCFLRASNSEILLMRFLILFWVYAWPLVMTLSLVAATRRRAKLLLVAAYGLGFAILAAIVLVRSPDSSVGQVAVLWLSTNLPPTVLLLVFLIRRVRAVGPLVVTFMILALTGSNLLLSILDRRQALLRSVAEVGFSLGLGGTGVFWAMNMIGFILFTIPGWFAVQWIRRRYQAKSVNDQSLTLDALWLLFGVSYAVGLVFEGAAWILSGLAAFAAYKAAVMLGFRTIAPAADSTRAVSLLLLRVFSLGKRSEELFDAVTRHWRYLGHVQLITGPDLAAATVEPHEFLAFLSGNLDLQFIDGPETLTRRVNELDTRPDFDGRFRVNDFFCHDDTWRMTLEQLVGESDVVLMDLRGFSRQNAGCVFEVHELVNSASLGRVVVTIDDTTDFPFLKKTLNEAWAGMRSDSPNRTGSGEVRIVRLDDSGGVGLLTLLQHLCAASDGTGAPSMSNAAS